MSDTTFTIQDDKKTLVIDRVFPAERSKVWEAWTTPELFAKWWGPRGWEWAFGLNDAIPLALKLETGATETRIDLTNLRVTDLRLKTGASSTDVQLPANRLY